MKNLLLFTAVSFLIVSLSASAGFGIKFSVRVIAMKTSYGDVVFSHDIHVQKTISCQACHPEPYVTREKHQTVTMQEMENGRSCGLCHNGTQAFSVKGRCTSCHQL